MQRFFGFIIFILGVALGGWVAYNLLVERTIHTQGKNPLPAVIISIGCMYVGFKWMRGKQAG